MTARRMYSGRFSQQSRILYNRGSEGAQGAWHSDVTLCTIFAPVWCSEVSYLCIGSVRNCFSENASGGFLLGSVGVLQGFCMSSVLGGFGFESPRLQSPGSNTTPTQTPHNPNETAIQGHSEGYLSAPPQHPNNTNLRQKNANSMRAACAHEINPLILHHWPTFRSVQIA